MIGILCGGPSSEREISLRSGRAIFEALQGQGLPVVLLPLSTDPEKIPDQIRAARIRCAFIALHGPFGEDGTIQQLLEELQIPYTGSSVEASRYAMDKIFCRLRWIAARLPVPRGVAVEPIGAAAHQHELPLPIVVKPAAQGSSFGISIVDRLADLPQAVEEAARYGDRLLLEEYLPGPELTVGILQDLPLPVIQLVPKRRFYDYAAKYTPGMTEYRVPAPLSGEETFRVQQIARRAHEALGCRCFSRVDLILVPGRGPVLLELNTIPGMTATSLLPKAAAAAGIDFPELCRRMLASAVAPPPELSAQGGSAFRPIQPPLKEVG